MLDAISRAVTKAIEKDAQKLLKRISKRGTKSSGDVLDSGPGDSRRTSDILRQINSNATSERRVSDDTYIEEDEEELMADREKWDDESKVICHLLGFVIGLSNIWRFPYLCHQYGGGAFLIPYFISLLLCAYPFVYLELLVGQYAQVGTIAAFKFVPLFKGVGMCMTLLAYMSSFNNQSVLAWCLFYLFKSIFLKPLPWISCNNGFGKLETGKKDDHHVKWSSDDTFSDARNWHTVNCSDFFADTGNDSSISDTDRLPGTEYFIGRVQRMWKSRYADAGEINETQENGAITFGVGSEKRGFLDYNWDTFSALITTCLIIQIFVQRGVKINSKSITLLVVIPFITMVLLGYRASCLNGAGEGFKLLFKPEWSKLGEAQTWWRATEQVLRSTGAGMGVHLTLASHNHQDHSVLFDATLIVFVNILTTLISTSVVFMFLGHIKAAVSEDISRFVVSGPELVFEAMADVLGVLAKSNFYSTCFYLMLFLTGLTTVTTSLISAQSSFLEVLPVQIKYRTKPRILIIVCFCLFSFFISSLSLTRGGLHTYAYFDTFLGSFSTIISAMLFLIGTVWVFGLEELILATHIMGIREPGIYFQLCWKYFAPLTLCFVLGGYALSSSSHDVIWNREEVMVTPVLKGLGYTLAFIPLLTVFYGAQQAYSKMTGKKKFLQAVSPTRDHKEIQQSGTGERANLSHYFYLYVSTPVNKCNICCGKMSRTTARPNQVEPEHPVPVEMEEEEGGSSDEEHMQDMLTDQDRVRAEFHVKIQEPGGDEHVQGGAFKPRRHSNVSSVSKTSSSYSTTYVQATKIGQCCTIS